MTGLARLRRALWYFAMMMSPIVGGFGLIGVFALIDSTFGPGGIAVFIAVAAVVALAAVCWIEAGNE